MVTEATALAGPLPAWLRYNLLWLVAGAILGARLRPARYDYRNK